jgi:hypothetical protein
MRGRHLMYFQIRRAVKALQDMSDDGEGRSTVVCSHRVVVTRVVGRRCLAGATASGKHVTFRLALPPRDMQDQTYQHSHGLLTCQKRALHRSFCAIFSASLAMAHLCVGLPDLACAVLPTTSRMAVLTSPASCSTPALALGQPFTNIALPR